MLIVVLVGILVGVVIDVGILIVVILQPRVIVMPRVVVIVIIPTMVVASLPSVASPTAPPSGPVTTAAGPALPHGVRPRGRAARSRGATSPFYRIRVFR